jgi:alkylation response protein AidB-like acyl-CoA dehydrogenase
MRTLPESGSRRIAMDRTALAELITRCGEREEADAEHYPEENVRDLRAAAFTAGPFAPEQGGHGWSLAEASRAIETLSAAAPSTALIASMPLGLAGIYAAPGDAIPEQHRATWLEQQAWVVDEYRAGRLFAACNSEKGAGGSLDAIKTTMTREDGRFCLTGEKILASSGHYADWFFSTAKVAPGDIEGAGVVEFFLVATDAPGVQIANDWDGFGMRATESQSVHYENAPVHALMGFPNFIEAFQPIQYWYCLFAAIPLGCARGMLETLGNPAPSSPALRLRLNEALMRYESARAYLLETAAAWRPAAGGAYAARVLRTKTYVTQESTRLCADLFALAGGRHYRQGDPMARRLADAFAGTALRPPLALALTSLSEQFDLESAGL